MNSSRRNNGLPLFSTTIENRISRVSHGGRFRNSSSSTSTPKTDVFEWLGSRKEPWKIYDFYKSRPRSLRGWIVHESFIMHEIIADEQFQVAPLTNASAAAVRFHARGRQRTDVSRPVSSRLVSSRRIAFETRGHGFLVKSVNHRRKRGFLYQRRIPPFLSSYSRKMNSFVRPRK